MKLWHEWNILNFEKMSNFFQHVHFEIMSWLISLNHKYQHRIPLLTLNMWINVLSIDKFLFKRCWLGHSFNIVCRVLEINHFYNVIMGAMASQITSLMIVYSIVHSSADQRKHQSSAVLASVCIYIYISWTMVLIQILLKIIHDIYYTLCILITVYCHVS